MFSILTIVMENLVLFIIRLDFSDGAKGFDLDEQQIKNFHIFLVI